MELIYIAYLEGFLGKKESDIPKSCGAEDKGSLLFIFLHTKFLLSFSGPVSTLVSEVKILTFPYI